MFNIYEQIYKYSKNVIHINYIGEPTFNLPHKCATYSVLNPTVFWHWQQSQIPPANAHASNRKCFTGSCWQQTSTLLINYYLILVNSSCYVIIEETVASYLLIIFLKVPRSSDNCMKSLCL